MAYYVYNPDDEADVAQYNKVQYRLEPGVNKFASKEAAEHIAHSLRMWGFRLLNGAADTWQPQIDAAEAEYLKATYAWARTLAYEYVERNERDQKGGLPPTVRTADEAKAINWVEANRTRLTAAGLI